MARKCLFHLITICSVSLLTVFFAVSAWASTAVVQGSVVNLRSAPEGRVIGQVMQGDRVQVLEASGDWSQVIYDNGRGTAWIHSSLIKAEVGNPDASGAEGQTAVVTGSIVNLRSGAGTSHAVVAEVTRGTCLPVVGKSGDWVNVQLPSGQTAWVAGWLIRVEGTPTPKPPPQSNSVQSTPAPSTPTEKTAVVSASVVKLRSGPGTSHSEVAQVSQGTRFPILGTSGHWVKIRLQSGQEAWIAGWLIRVEGTPVQPPSTTPNDPDPPADPPASGQPEGEEAVPAGTVAVVKANSLDIKDSPGARSSSIAQATAGFKLPVIAQSGSWYKVKLPTGSMGWVPENEVSVIREDQPSRGSDNDGPSSGPWTIDTEETGDRTELVIKSASPFKVETFTLSGPDRLVIDLIGVAVDDLPADIKLRSEAVDEIRIGRQADNPPTGRVVCDLAEGLGYTRYRTDLSSDGRTLRVDLWTVEDVLEDLVIVLDPGHGGADPGAIGPTGFKEKDFNLPVAQETARLLRQEGAEVILTRTTDIRLGSTVAEDLEARSRIANTHQADLFVSIHANANLTRSKGGTSVYYHAHPENHTDCVKLARALQNSLVRELGRQDLGIFGSNFLVLRGIDMPGALVETAFISNYEEESLLRQSSFQKKAAAGIVEGIRTYFGS